MERRLNAVVGARINKFKKKMAEVRRIMKTTPTKAEAEVDAETKKFHAKMKAVKAALKDIQNARVVVKIRENFKTTQDRLDRLSQTINTLTNVGGNMVMGSLLAISPGAVPLLAGAIASLAMLGPMLGVLGGSTFGLGSAFALAGAGALAFAGVAIPTISKLFGDTEKLTKAQLAARKEFDKMKDTWNSIASDLEKPVLEAFSESMRITNKVLKMSRPLFDSAATAVNNLLDSLNASLGSSPVKAFFEYMNSQGGPLLERIGKSFGNFMQGLLSMITAFAPLTDSVSGGFLNMSENFAKWAAGLSKSEKFQSFIKYVQENMPKVKTIFRDSIAGITYFFAAFGPLSADMMTGLADLMTRFKEWSRTLGENKSFQGFISYIRENGPAMLAFIGEFSRLMVNLAKALAPTGAKILELTNKFLNWFNTLMENNPVVGKIIAGIVVVSGVFRALFPIITVAISMFSGFGGMLMKIFPALSGVFSTMKLNLIVGLKMIGRQALKQGARMAAGFVIAMGPVAWVIAGVIALVALIIWKWKEISTATKKVWTAIGLLLKAVWRKMVEATVKAAVELYSKAKGKFTELLDFVTGLKTSFKNAGKGLIDMMAKGILNGIGTVTSAISTVASKVRDFLPFSPAETGPLKDINRLNFGGPIKDSIINAKSMIQSAMGNMLQLPEVGLNAQLSTASTQSFSVSTPNSYESKRDGNSIGEQVAAALGNLVVENKISINEREFIEATGKPMMKYMDQETKKEGRKGGYVR